MLSSKPYRQTEAARFMGAACTLTYNISQFPGCHQSRDRNAPTESPLSIDDAKNARQARCYLRARSHGVLSTLSRRMAGYPYGSVIPFVLDHEGQPVILVSGLAEHTKNMEANHRASLVARDGGGEVQSGARLTLLGDAERFECNQRLRERYLRYQPHAEELLGLGDFSFWRIVPLALRFIAGFGAIGWVSARDFIAPASKIEAAESDILAQMNDRHADALHACWVRASGTDVGKALMIGVDCDGFDMTADGPRMRLDFPEMAPDPESVQRAVFDLAQSAR